MFECFKDYISNSRIRLQKQFTERIEGSNLLNNRLPTYQPKTSSATILKAIQEKVKKEEKEEEAKKMEQFQTLRNKELEITRRRKIKNENLTKINSPKYIYKKDYITIETNAYNDYNYRKRKYNDYIFKTEVKKGIKSFYK